ncbi:MAG TPA: HPr family phosphocarrier protein [Gemmatimonadales bacterium]|nr:HPr family phosphocarrier protein [Gemmatimonadales bacterium]
MIERVVTIRNEMGMHARPAAQFVRMAATFDATIEIDREGMAVNGKSIMGVMMLAAEYGCDLVLRADGADAEAAVSALAELIERGFGE